MRGGFGMRRDWEILAEEAFVNLRSDRFKHSALGLDGALVARPSSAALNPGTQSEQALPSKVTGLKLKRGDVFRIQYGGGGGRGSPLERDPESVLQDVWNGYLSAQMAREVYGVAVEGWPPALNLEETRRLRARRAKS